MRTDSRHESRGTTCERRVEVSDDTPPPRKRTQYSPLTEAAISAVSWGAPVLGRIPFLRDGLVHWGRQRFLSIKDPDACSRLLRLEEERRTLGVAVLQTLERCFADNRISRATIRHMMQVLFKEQFLHQGDWDARERFSAQYGVNPPSFLVISPTKSCNLHCTGCYANSSSPDREKLRWDVFDQLITEVRHLWGGRFVVISGGEPLMYRDEGRDLLDMAEAHPDMFFMFYTNGTIIGERTARRMSELGNIMPAISVEGMRERTDERRGEGIFDKILAAMQRLRRERVFYGISMTATRYNYQELLSDELLDFFFDEMGVGFGWIFHYMPIGRSFTLDLMPTPEQRKWMWEHMWQQVRRRQIFLADFWNSGTIVDGCLSAGRSGGYFYIDWNGNMAPCVFMPYAPLNINDVYEQGGTLNDAWTNPFFRALRQWQYDYGYRDGGSKCCHNFLMPCPIRDHHADFEKLLRAYEPEPIDEAAAALVDSSYHEGLREFDRQLAEVTDPIWRSYYESNAVSDPHA